MKNKGLLASSMLIFGIVVILFSIYFYLDKSSQFNKYDGETKGKIIEYIGTLHNKTPVIKYSVDEKEYTLIDSSKVVNSMQNKEIKVLYMKNNIEDARIYDDYQIWGVPLSIFIVGVFCSIFGFIIYRVGF
jgi:hypothetical protein